MMTQAELEAVWDGRLVLMTKRATLTDLSRRFDITWFLGAVHKYRRLLSEVLLASFFLQLFALVSPLFFQVVIDKVLVHRSMSTLDVLAVGLVAIALFETVLGILRTYLFSHTTNRIDVELGARLFRHLLALPIGYFQARRVGDSVARVRELENIRNFLTSSGLTLVIDLFFTFIFLAVLFFYSPLLTWIVLASFPFYIGISAGATPLFQQRLDEKFRRGAENQAFLVESVTGIETLKAMAVEPQMQRRWEEQLAGYVAASFRVISLGNIASQTVQFVSKLVTRGDSLFRGEARHRRRAYGRRTDRLQPAGGPRQCARPATGANMAGFPSGATVGRPPRRYSQYRARAGLQSRPNGACRDPRRHQLRARQLPLSHRRPGNSARHQSGRASRPSASESLAPPDRARVPWPSSCSAFTCPRAAAC